MLYIQEADKVQRTARWLEERAGGIEELYRVIVEDSLGIGDELEAAMANHVATYEDEWTATVNDPQRMAKFVSFINAPGVADPELAWVPERADRKSTRLNSSHVAIS